MYLFDLHDIRQENNFFQAQWHHNVSCPAHLHYSMEIVCVTSGTVVMEVSGKIRAIHSGEATLVFPFEPHSFETPEKSECFVLLFSPELVEDFYASIQNKTPLHAVCRISAWTLEMCKKNLSEQEQALQEALHAKAILYPLCEEFWRKSGFESTPSPSKKTVFTDALTYISQNFHSGDISLYTVAKALGVHYVYLSRVFHQCCGVHYTKYVNMLRCFYAIRLLRESPERSISQIALEAGFGSVRSFNREFQSVYGMSPHKKRLSP